MGCLRLRLRAIAPIGLIIAVLITANALGWASHIDWPADAPSAAGHAHSETTVFSAAALDDGGDLVDAHGDHCEHAGAHLLALPAADAPIIERDRMRPTVGAAVAADSGAAEPPYIPPIA